MCGICGFVGSRGMETFQPMMRTLVHRGPDEDGSWIGQGVALGMRRLAIIDVETGQQPMFNEDGDVAVVFNGEIYNFLELRKELMASGHRFSTDHSDTEVIVHLYEERGDEFLHKLNGHVCNRTVGRALATIVAGARPCRHQASLLRARWRRAGFWFRAQGGARPSGCLAPTGPCGVASLLQLQECSRPMELVCRHSPAQGRRASDF